MIASPEAGRLAPIEALRAIAALGVAAFHFQLDVVRALPQAQLPDLIRGAAGVDVFFVISGFVIARSAAAAPDSHGAGYFAVRRLIRIVPLYWSVTLLYLALATVLADRGGTFTLPLILASFVFIPFARSDGTVQPVVGQGWSLNFEMLFYAIYAGAIALSRRHASFIAVGVLVAIAIAGRWPSGSVQIEFWTSAIILEFALGIALAELHGRGVRVRRPLAIAAAVLAAAILLFAPIASGEFADARVLWVGGPATLLVAAVVFSDRPFLPAWRLVMLLGAASYAMYLLHSLPNRLFILVAQRAGLDLGTPAIFLVVVALALAATTILSVMVYLAFERPVMQRLQQRFTSRAPTGEIAAQPRRSAGTAN